MKLRHRYLIAGIAWALFLGPAVALVLFGFAAGVSWLWLFGNDPWPEATKWALPLIGIAGGIVTAGLCIGFALSYGRQRERQPKENLPRERRKALLLTATPLALILVAGALLWKEAADEAAARKLAGVREASFARLLAARHEITGMTVEQDERGAFHAVVQLTGNREGDYRLHWQVSGTSFGAILAEGDRVLSLQEGRQSVDLSFSLEVLARSYRDKVLSGGGVLVEEPFKLAATLEPILEPGQAAALPPIEQHRLELGESPLRVREVARFPVRFTIRHDGSLHP